MGSSRHYHALAVVLALALPALLATGASAQELKAERLNVRKGIVRAVRARDLTGDGVKDIVAFTDDSDGVSICVFLADERGWYLEPGPNVTIRPMDHGLGQVYYACLANLELGKPAEILLVDKLEGIHAMGVRRKVDHYATLGIPADAPSGEIEAAFRRLEEKHRKPGDDGGDELFQKIRQAYEILSDSAGRRAHDEERRVFVAGAPRRIADAPPLPFYPDETRISVLDVASDLDGDGDEELILPSEDGYHVFRAGEGVDGDEVDCGVDHSLTVEPHRFLTLHWKIPRVTVADWDADGLSDIIAGRGGAFLLFLQRSDGSFLRQARALDILSPKPDDPERALLTMGDVNGDNKVDLLVTRSPANVPVMGSFNSQQSLYLNPRFFGPRARLSTPADTFRTEGISVNPELIDFDGDGDLDVIVTSIRITVSSKLRGKVPADYRVFRFDQKTKAFEKSPYFDISRPFPPAQLEANSTAPVCFFHGDFDGDGKKDLLDIADNGHLTILKGTTHTGFLSSEKYTFKEFDGQPLFSAPAKVENDVLITALTGKGVSDAVAYRGQYIYLIRGAR